MYHQEQARILHEQVISVRRAVDTQYNLLSLKVEYVLVDYLKVSFFVLYLREFFYYLRDSLLCVFFFKELIFQ